MKRNDNSGLILLIATCIYGAFLIAAAGNTGRPWTSVFDDGFIWQNNDDPALELMQLYDDGQLILKRSGKGARASGFIADTSTTSPIFYSTGTTTGGGLVQGTVQWNERSSNKWGTTDSVEVDGQVILPTTGSGGGLLVGGDVNWYRNGVDEWKTDDSVEIAGQLQLITQDAMNITAYQPFITLVDTNDSNKRGRILSAGGGLYFFHEAGIGGTAGAILTNGAAFLLGGATTQSGTNTLTIGAPNTAISSGWNIHSTAQDPVTGEWLKKDIRDSKSGELVADPLVQKATPHVRTYLLDKKYGMPTLASFADKKGVTEIISITEIPEQILAPEDAWEATQVIRDTAEIIDYEYYFVEESGNIYPEKRPIYAQETVWQKFRKPEVQFDEKTGTYSIPAHQEITRTTKEIIIETAQEQLDKKLAELEERNKRPAYNISQKGFIAQELPTELQAEGGVGWSLNAMIVYLMERDQAQDAEIVELRAKIAVLEKDKVPNHEERIKGLEGK